MTEILIYIVVDYGRSWEEDRRRLLLARAHLKEIENECAKQRAFKPEGENLSHAKPSQQHGTNICSVGSNEYIEAK